MHELRPYQLRMAATVERGNSIVLLPTGAGKTLVAAEAIRRMNTAGRQSLFLVSLGCV